MSVCGCGCVPEIDDYCWKGRCWKGRRRACREACGPPITVGIVTLIGGDRKEPHLCPLRLQELMVGRMLPSDWGTQRRLLRFV